MIEFYRNYPAAADALRGPIFEDKVIDYVLDSASVTDAEISAEALEQDPEEATPAGKADAPDSLAPAEPAPAEAPSTDAVSAEPAGESVTAPTGDAVP